MNLRNVTNLDSARPPEPEAGPRQQLSDIYMQTLQSQTSPLYDFENDTIKTELFNKFSQTPMCIVNIQVLNGPAGFLWPKGRAISDPRACNMESAGAKAVIMITGIMITVPIIWVTRLPREHRSQS